MSHIFPSILLRSLTLVHVGVLYKYQKLNWRFSMSEYEACLASFYILVLWPEWYFLGDVGLPTFKNKSLILAWSSSWDTLLNELKFGNVGFWEEGKTRVPGGKRLWREPTANSSYICWEVWESNPGHIGGRRVLSPLRHHSSPNGTRIFCVCSF